MPAGRAAAAAAAGGPGADRRYGTYAHTAGEPAIWNEQLIRYAGYRLPDGTVVGDPRHADLTRLAHYQDHGILKAITSDVTVMRKPR